MILIADSGSTKTHWTLRTNNGQTSDFFTDGINPFFQTADEITNNISNQLFPQLVKYMWIGKITHIYFYGAGCAFLDKKEMIASALKSSFRDAKIEVETDLLGAAHGLFGHEAGIVCILGTGSNSCLYNGKEITKNVSPLGFILGDEGSGAVLGKRLVADMLKNQLPEELKVRFLNRFQLTPALILDAVYKQAFPNRFLASLSIFLIENIHIKEIYDIVYECFDDFVKRNLLQYSTEKNAVSFVGSVAFYYAEILKVVIEKNGLTLGQIEKSPMLGLLKYHSGKKK